MYTSVLIYVCFSIYIQREKRKREIDASSQNMDHTATCHYRKRKIRKQVEKQQ